MFTPPFCPYADCRRRNDPRPGFFRRHGGYQPKCRAAPVPRFRCNSCRRTFSRQTFRADFRFHKPFLDPILFFDFASGVSLRQMARKHRIARRTVELRLERFAAHARAAHETARARIRPAGTFQLDELETFEHHRVLKPLTVPVLLHGDSWYLFAQAVGTLRSRATQHPRSKARRKRFEERFGKRRNESRETVKACFDQLKPLVEPVLLITDQKASYARLVAERFPRGWVHHVRVAGRLPRTPDNPLFPINHMNAMLRYGMSRLIRRSFAASKTKRGLERHLAIHRLWWNGWRLKTNKSRVTPGQAIGAYRRRLKPAELFGWSQRFGAQSIRLDHVDGVA